MMSQRKSKEKKQWKTLGKEKKTKSLQFVGRGCGRNETYWRKSNIIIYPVLKSVHTGRS